MGLLGLWAQLLPRLMLVGRLVCQFFHLCTPLVLVPSGQASVPFLARKPISQPLARAAGYIWLLRGACDLSLGFSASTAQICRLGHLAKSVYPSLPPSPVRPLLHGGGHVS